jgi:hypothetical protein
MVDREPVHARFEKLRGLIRDGRVDDALSVTKLIEDHVDKAYDVVDQVEALLADKFGKR